MGKLSCRFAVHANALDSHTLKKSRHDDAAYRIDGIESHLESGLAHSLDIDCRKRQHRIKMLIGKVTFFNISKRIHIRECEILSFGTFKNRRTFLSVEELSFLIKKLEGIPLLWIMGSRKDDSSVSFFENHRHFSCRSRGEACLHHIHAA